MSARKRQGTAEQQDFDTTGTGFEVQYLIPAEPQHLDFLRTEAVQRQDIPPVPVIVIDGIDDDVFQVFVIELPQFHQDPATVARPR